jgi:DNA polymerase-3 subunit epsilon
MISKPSPNILIEAFEKIQARYPEILLTGSLSVALQGFKVRRSPVDLDVILFGNDSIYWNQEIKEFLPRYIPEFDFVSGSNDSFFYEPDENKMRTRILFKGYEISIDFFFYDSSFYKDFFCKKVRGIPCVKFSIPFKFKLEYALDKTTISSQKHIDDIIYFIQNNSVGIDNIGLTQDNHLGLESSSKALSNFMGRDVVFFDLETTGVDTQKDKIIEIFAKKLTVSGEIYEYYSKINPEMDVSAEASKVHGIYNKDLVDELTFADVAEDLFNFFVNCEVGGYNIKNFDIPILNRQFFDVINRSPFELNQTYLDCFSIIQQLEPRKLESMYFQYTNRVLFNAHSAESDVNATIELFAEIIKRNRSWVYNDIKQLLSEKNKVLDFDKKFYEDELGVARFNFGKNRDDAISLHEDYLKWMLNQDFSASTKAVIYEYLAKKQQEQLIEKAKQVSHLIKINSRETEGEEDDFLPF